MSLVITSYFFLHRSQMVKCEITSFWQPTQAFINLFIPSASSIPLSLQPLYLVRTLVWPTAPIVMFNPMLPFSHCYFHGLQKMPLDSQLPRHQWLEMTNEATVDWTRRAAGLESILGLLLCDMIWHLWSNTGQKKNVDLWPIQSAHVNLSTRQRVYSQAKAQWDCTSAQWCFELNTNVCMLTCSH